MIIELKSTYFPFAVASAITGTLILEVFCDSQTDHGVIVSVYYKTQGQYKVSTLSVVDAKNILKILFSVSLKDKCPTSGVVIFLRN